MCFPQCLHALSQDCTIHTAAALCHLALGDEQGCRLQQVFNSLRQKCGGDGCPVLTQLKSSAHHVLPRQQNTTHSCGCFPPTATNESIPTNYCTPLKCLDVKTPIPLSSCCSPVLLLNGWEKGLHTGACLLLNICPTASTALPQKSGANGGRGSHQAAG